MIDEERVPMGSQCAHQWVVVEQHYLRGTAHKLQRCQHCTLERLVRRSDGKVVATGPLVR
jgi:hypothetical protein